MAVLRLFVALWGLIGAQTTVRHVGGPVDFTDLYGSERHAAAALECRPGGKPLLYVSLTADIETILHEFAHAYDCIDDGSMNASPIGQTRPAQRPGWASDYCWNTDAEWYACWVLHSLNVRPALPPGEATAPAAKTGTTSSGAGTSPSSADRP